MIDPFATAPDEAQVPAVAPESPAQAPAATAEVTTPAPVSAPAEGHRTEIVTTFKAGSSFDQPWVVIHAGSVAESDTLLDQEFADYLGKVKRVAGFFNGGGSAPAASAPLQNGQPAGSVEAPAWAPAKPFSDFVYVTKVSAKTGKPWHAWMAPGKGDSRDPLFFNPPR